MSAQLEPMDITMSNNEETPGNTGAAPPPSEAPNERGNNTTNNPRRSNTKNNREQKKPTRHTKDLQTRHNKKQQTRHDKKKQTRRQRVAEGSSRLSWRRASISMELQLSGVRRGLQAEAARGVGELRATTELRVGELAAAAQQREAELHREIRRHQRRGRVSEGRAAELLGTVHVDVGGRVASVRAAAEARAGEIDAASERRGDVITQQVRRRLDSWDVRWAPEEMDEIERGVAESGIRRGIRREMAEESTKIERREKQLLAEVNQDVSWAIGEMDMQVEEGFRQIKQEKQEVLDEMDRIDRELSRVERRLAKCQLEGE